MRRTHTARAPKTIAELRKKICLCEKYKKELSDFLQQVKDKWLAKEITYSEYKGILYKKRQGKTLLEWFEYYDSYIEKCKVEIKRQQRKISKNRTLSILFVSFLFLILFFSSFFIRPTLIGFVIKEKQELTQTINVSFNQSEIYKWQLEHYGILDSVKISGSIEGKGRVKIYLEDLLIFDNKKLSKKRTITGFAVHKNSNKNLTGETPQTTQNLSVGSSQEESSNLSNFSNLTIPKFQSKENLTKGAGIQTTQNLSVGSSQNESLAPLEEKATITNMTSQALENITNITEPTPTPIQENITEEIKKISFSDICLETCDISNLNLNKTSYNLRIEVESAKLNLEKIKYKISLIKPEILPPKISPNITKANVTNVTKEKIEVPFISHNPDIRELSAENVSVKITCSAEAQYIRHCWTTNKSCKPGEKEKNTCLVSGKSCSVQQTRDGNWTLCSKCKSNNWSLTLCTGPYQINKTISFPAFLPPPEKPVEEIKGATYGPFSITKCSQGICNTKIFMNQIAIKDKNGIYRPFREVVKVNTSNNLLTIKWNDKSVTFAPYVEYKKQKYEVKLPHKIAKFPEIPQEIPFQHRRIAKKHEYEYEIRIPQLSFTTRKDTDKVGLEVAEVSGFDEC